MSDIKKTYTDYDLSENANITTVRKEFLRPAIDAKNFAEIDRILSHIVATRPDRIKEKVERIDHALTAGQRQQAQSYFKEIDITSGPRDSKIEIEYYVSCLRIALSLKENEQAAVIAKLFLPDFDGNPSLALFAMRAFDRAGYEAEFLATTEIVHRLCSENQEHLAEMAFLLNNHDQTSKTLDWLSGLDIDGTQNFDLLLQYGRAFLKAKPLDPRTLQTLSKAVELNPDNRYARILLSRAYMRCAKVRAALDVLNYDPDTIDSESESMRAQAAETLMLNGRHQDAAHLLKRLVADNPKHGSWKRALVSSLLMSGEKAEAEAIYDKDLEARDMSGHSDFASALRGLESQTHTANIPSARFEWAAQRLAYMNRPIEDRAAWEKENRKNYLADLLTLNWLESRPEDVGQILELMDGLEEAVEVLEQHVASGVGAFLVSCHIGALFAGPVSLAMSPLSYRWVASTPQIAKVPGAEFLLSTFSENRLKLAKKIYREVREGSVVAIAIDGSSTVGANPVPFLDDHISLSDFVPRAVYQMGAKSFLPSVAWSNGRIKVKLTELAAPAPTDTLDDFISTWFEDFTQALAKMFYDHPDNLRLSGGFWTEVSL